MTRTLLLVVSVTLLAAFAAASDPASSAIGKRSCPVTTPKRHVAPDAGFTAAGFNYGNASLRAHLYWPRGTVVAGVLPGGGAMAVINPDGSILVKVGWWRGVSGKLVVRGRRLDAHAPSLRDHVPAGYGDRGFQPTGLTFPTLGCWRVTGRVGRAHLTFVVKVTKREERRVRRSGPGAPS